MQQSDVQRGKFYRAIVDGVETDVLVDQKIVAPGTKAKPIYELMLLPNGRKVVRSHEVQFLYERKEVAEDGGPVLTDQELDAALNELTTAGLLVARPGPEAN